MRLIESRKFQCENLCFSSKVPEIWIFSLSFEFFSWVLSFLHLEFFFKCPKNKPALYSSAWGPFWKQTVPFSRIIVTNSIVAIKSVDKFLFPAPIPKIGITTYCRYLCEIRFRVFPCLNSIPRPVLRGDLKIVSRPRYVDSETRQPGSCLLKAWI